MSSYCYFYLAVTILAKRGGENLFAYPATWIVLASIAVLIFVYCKGRSSRDEEIKSIENSCNRKIKDKEEELGQIIRSSQAKIKSIEESCARELKRKNEELSSIINSSRDEIDSIRRAADSEITKTNEQWRITKELILGDTMRLATVDERIERMMEKEDETLRRVIAERAPTAAEQVKRLSEKNRKLQLECLQYRTRAELYEKIEPQLKRFLDCPFQEIQQLSSNTSENDVLDSPILKQILNSPKASHSNNSTLEEACDHVKNIQLNIKESEKDYRDYPKELQTAKIEIHGYKVEIQALTKLYNDYKNYYVEAESKLHESELKRAHAEHQWDIAEQQRDEAIQKREATEQRWREAKALITGENILFPTVDERIEKLMLSVDDAVCAELAERAPRAADEIRKIKAEKRALWRKNILLQTRINVYEAFAPWMDEYMDCTLEEILAAKDEFDQLEELQESDDAPERRYLSASDYKNLSEVERNQLALDRYWDAHARKNLWLVGIQYERYIGWLYEKDGYAVAYHGALNGKEDLGIDLVATKGAKTYIIQCKRYSEIKKIPVRENSVAQIFGAAKVYAYQNGLIDATPVIVTSFELSKTATLFAKALGVEVREHEALKQYPCIKCNINNSTGEKIYHLPFDQMYDHTVIEPDKGEFYAASVKEAYNAGFRRAYRWRGESTK